MSTTPTAGRVGMWAELYVALRINVVPAVVIWTIGLAIVLSYFFLPALRPAFDLVEAAKEGGGLFYVVPAMVLFNGLIPTLVERLRLGRWMAPPRRLLVFLVLFWAWRGIEVDLLYRSLDAWLGASEGSLAIIAAKVACDQFGYAALWAVPTNAWAYAWRDGGLTRRSFASGLRGLPRRYGVVLLSNWLVWVPGVALIYSLPLPLQFPLCNLIGCFYVLLLQVLAVPAPDELQVVAAVGVCSVSTPDEGG